MIINVEFTEDMTKNRVHIDRVFKGYNAQYYKTALMMLPEDDRKKMLDEIVKYFALDAEIESLDVVQKKHRISKLDR
jgi:F0F1-type ATP synthase delta subunit